ncbi:MAG: hypothetical protein BWY42_01559 [Candidatus Omnitrophica bacterium ADurb.Bin277]|nr:MAG: hypothetical protein BWY42_01559 [Candidatus Omnitrophica bacterium ADurb.Bin277]
MAQYQIFRKTALCGFFKGVNVIKPFSDERPFKKQILVNIRNRFGIRINSVLAAKNPHKKRWRFSGITGLHPGLENSVSRNHSLLCLIINGPIQRMSNHSHEVPRRVTRHPGIRVQSDYVFHAL